MQKFTWLTFLLLLSLHGLGYAQTTTVTGKVTDAKGGALPGVTVLARGTGQGTSTNASGVYLLTVPDTTSLVFSSIGYDPQTVAVRGRTTIDVTLSENVQALGEVVVTALNVARERKTLGYSVTEIQGNSLTQARETNVTNSLVGKVAGLNVNSTSGGAGSSSNVIIRGVSSLSQTNQPLYVINGIPVESQPSSANTGSRWDNSPDLGDAISNINPDDIESISVLKGAAASALYGYRAKAGVILITTKSAKGNDGVEYNSNYVIEKIYNLTDWQYVYGQGDNNRIQTTMKGVLDAGIYSWGSKLNGDSIALQFDGEERAYVAQKNNLQNFYRTGSSWTNTLAFNKSFTGGSVRLSASNLTNKAVIPNSGLNRQTFNLAGTFEPIKRLAIDARATYILEQAQNRAILADGAGNANFNVLFLPTSVDVRTLKPRVKSNGNELNYETQGYNTNPYFAAYDFINDTKRERLLSSVNARYTFDNGLFLQGRAGRDGYTDRFTSVTPSGTTYRLEGSIMELTTQFSDLNTDGLVGKNFEIGSDFTVAPNLGASYRRTKSEAFQNNGTNFAVFGVNSLNNAKNRSSQTFPSDQEIQSVYGSLDLSYKEYLFLTTTLRRDWFSTLAGPIPTDDLGITYPGVSGSFVFSELWRPEFLTFGKLRAGYSRVGQATIPYQTQLNYAFLPNVINGNPLATIANVNVPNSGLQPSSATEFEIGTELALAQNRVRLDLTFYKKNSDKEIVFTPASITSGYQGAVLNAGKMENKGVEALLTVLPVKTAVFTWTSSLNAAYNKNTVLSLAAGQEQSVYATSRSNVGFVGQIVNKPSGQILAYDYKYDTDGSIATTPNGLPARGDLKAYGTAFHPLTGGWSNDFTFKGLNFGVLVDGKFGGKIFSATDYYGTVFGLHKKTLENREESYGTDGKVTSREYYGTLANNVSKQFVQDADFIKLRQVTLGYSFPTKLLGTKVQRLTLSLVARNIAILMRKTDNIDPESSYNAFTQGLELGGIPPVRTFGLNLNAKF
ncbi:SusC/RagA family TonB-linked outer membrane protein [Hymenobacter sp. J193]|uniref:SusC/RagA family TonB-linked outer membrane protein n=1 Tax=Hymenobacter sp. J193 TaxID=2898429 RepID=UPI0021512C29|nr:SusC/RagA family TonB-linked outer membrane protein [Hymenobacter sp. J193]MCR5889837.1 SusC/RagA family TonB-linked outer membrane protein [Hymenobacter sp. J193]